MARADSDYLILGGGCAGLSMAVHLLEAGLGNRRITLLESRSHYENDRSWCRWHWGEHPFQSCVSHRWTRWQVRREQGQAEAASTQHPYEYIAGKDFYDYALARLERDPRVELHLGVEVSETREDRESVAVESTQGSLRGKVVLDARHRFPTSGYSQHFLGWFVRSSKPVFDPDVALLMDFRVDDSQGIHFVYILPFAADYALVEDTYFSASALETQEYETNLRNYLEAHYGAVDFAIEAKERGRIPMMSREIDPHPSPRHYLLGTRGGWVKPSTGYAFHFIQRSCRALAQAFAKDELPPWQRPRSAWTESLDRVFLSYLEHHPEQASALFLQLFSRVPAQTLIRFLMEESTLNEDLAVMRSVPWLPFVSEVARAFSPFVRSRP